MENKLSIEDYELCNKLKNMRFSGMAEALEDLMLNPNADLLPFRQIVQKLVDAEWDLRYNKKLNRFIKKATLKYPGADFDDSIYDPERMLDTHVIEELSKCKWVEQGKTLSLPAKPVPVKVTLPMHSASVPCVNLKQSNISRQASLLTSYPKPRKRMIIKNC